MAGSKQPATTVLNTISKLIDEAREDGLKVDGGNKAAATRFRKVLGAIAKSAKDARGEVLEHVRTEK